MSLVAHLAELERKHSVLDKKLSDELAHPHLDETRIAALKRQKLVLKDEISRLKATPKPPNTNLH